MSSESLVRTAYPPIAGWRKRKTSLLEFYKCPGCGGAQESLFIDENDHSQCFKCNQKFPKENFGTAIVKRGVVECGNCGTDVHLTPSNANMFGIGYLCSQCQSYVAVEYGNRLVDPIEALKPSWNPSLQQRGKQMETDLLFLPCRTTKDYLIVRIMQLIAKTEDGRFMLVRKGDQAAALLLGSDQQKYLGFIVWHTEKAHATLHQIFIVPDERKKGLATRLIEYWVKEYADKISNTFGIEAPNDKALRLHAKLGHLKIDGDTATGVKCFFAPTM